MDGYRLYFMDRYSGHIDHRRDFLAESDAAAIETAQGWYDGRPMELWLRSHKLKTWVERPFAPLPVGNEPTTT